MKYVLEASQVVKTYGTHTALQGIDFAIEKGEIFALLGPNGAGKSTMIAILCGLISYDHGSVLIEGIDVKKHRKIAHHKVGVVFQDSRLDEQMSGYQNLLVRCGFYNIRAQEKKERIQYLSVLCQLEDFLHQRVASLSGGQRRRLDIARALISKPSLLILDEPTTGLDPISRTHIWEMLLGLQKQKEMAILLTTHYMEEASYAHHICMIVKGTIVARGSKQELMQTYVKNYLKLYAQHEEQLKRKLSQMKICYQNREGYIEICLTKKQNPITILHQCEHYIDYFEMIQGSLDEVYKTIIKGEGL